MTKEQLIALSIALPIGWLLGWLFGSVIVFLWDTRHVGKPMRKGRGKFRL